MLAALIHNLDPTLTAREIAIVECYLTLECETCNLERAVRPATPGTEEIRKAIAAMRRAPPGFNDQLAELFNG